MNTAQLFEDDAEFLEWTRVHPEAYAINFRANRSAFVEAVNIYAEHPEALQLRAMNIIYETTKERGATILIPTSMIDSLNPATAATIARAGDGSSQVARKW